MFISFIFGLTVGYKLKSRISSLISKLKFNTKETKK